MKRAPRVSSKMAPLHFSLKVDIILCAQAHADASPPVSDQQPHPGGGSQDDLSRKKRGRPRKYKPDSPSQPSTALVVVPATPGPEKRRGRPPGSGKMQQLASLGNQSRPRSLLFQSSVP